VPYGMGWSCHFSVLFSNFLRVARPTLAVWHRWLYVALPAGSAFFFGLLFVLIFILPAEH